MASYSTGQARREACAATLGRAYRLTIALTAAPAAVQSARSPVLAHQTELLVSLSHSTAPPNASAFSPQHSPHPSIVPIPVTATLTLQSTQSTRRSDCSSPFRPNLDSGLRQYHASTLPCLPPSLVSSSSVYSRPLDPSYTRSTVAVAHRPLVLQADETPPLPTSLLLAGRLNVFRQYLRTPPVPVSDSFVYSPSVPVALLW